MEIWTKRFGVLSWLQAPPVRLEPRLASQSALHRLNRLANVASFRMPIVGACVALVLRRKSVIAALSRARTCEIYAGLRSLVIVHRVASSRTLICAMNAMQISEREQSPENEAGVCPRIAKYLLAYDLTRLM